MLTEHTATPTLEEVADRIAHRTAGEPTTPVAEIIRDERDAISVTLVVDASAVVEFVLGSTQGRNAGVVMATHTTLHGPALITAEAFCALRALERRAEISPARSAEAAPDVLSVPLRRYPTEPLAGRIWSMRHSVTVYDLTYTPLGTNIGDSP